MTVVGQVTWHVDQRRFGARHHQRGAGLHQHRWRDAVDVAKLRLAHAHELGGLGGLERLGRHPHRPGGERPVVLRQVAHEGVGRLVRQQHLRRSGGEDHRPVHLRIELLELLEIDASQLGSQFDIDVALDRDAEEVGVVLQRRQREAIGIGLGDDVLHGLQLGHVVTRLRGHAAQAFVDTGGVRRSLALQCALDVAFAPVVGGQGELPIAVEHHAEPFEIVERGARRGQHVATVVTEGVLFERVDASGRRHELPHAGGACHRHRLRVECALDEWQQRKVERHVALLELLDHVVQVAAAALGHACHVVGPFGVVLLPLANACVVHRRHRVAGAQARPQVDARARIVKVHPLFGLQRVGRLRRAGGRRVGRCRRGLGRRSGRRSCRRWCRRRRTDSGGRRSDRRFTIRSGRRRRGDRATGGHCRHGQRGEPRAQPRACTGVLR